jgi:hypothetical protein
MKKLLRTSSLFFVLLLCVACEPQREAVTETSPPEVAAVTPTASLTATAVLPTATSPLPTPTPSSTPLPSQTPRPNTTPTPRRTVTATLIPLPFDRMVGLTPVLTPPNEPYWYFAADSSTLVWGNAKQARIYDVSDPFKPKQIGLVEAAPINSPEVVGDFVYLDVGSITHVWNPSQPDSLTPVESRLLAGWPWFTTAQQQIYLIDRSNPDQLMMRVIDMRGLAESQEVAMIDWALAAPQRIRVIGGLVHAFYDGYLTVVDVTSLSTAIEVKTLSLPVNTYSQIEVVADRVYLYSDSIIYVFDVSDPADPEQIGQYQAQWNANYFDVVGHRVYLTWQVCGWEPTDDGGVSGGCGQGIELVDFTDPAEPLYLGVLRLGMPAEWIEATYFTVEAAYFVTSTDIYALDLEGQVLP